MKTQMFVKQMAVLSSVLLGAALQTAAQPGPGGPGGPGGFARLELTAEQQAKLREARQASENERSELNQKVVAAQKEAVAAALAENPDEKTLRSKVEAVTKLQTELAMLNCRSFKDVKFTDEQKERLTSRPPLGSMVLFGGMGPGGMGGLGGFGGGRRGGGPGGTGGTGAGGAGGVNK